jgi:hypothetical protein
MCFVASHQLFGTWWLLKLDCLKVKAYITIPLYTNSRFANIPLYEMQNLRDIVRVYKLLPLANLSSIFVAGPSDTCPCIQAPTVRKPIVYVCCWTFRHISVYTSSYRSQTCRLCVLLDLQTHVRAYKLLPLANLSSMCVAGPSDTGV